MCQVHTGAYVSLLSPRKNDYTACHRRKTTTYILHLVPITTHTHDRRKSIGKKKRRKGKERRQESKKMKKERKDEKRQEKQGKTRKRKQGRRREKNVVLADPRN